MKRVLIIAALLVLNVVVPAQACDTDYECQMRGIWACQELYDPDSPELAECIEYASNIFGERMDSQLVQDYLDYLNDMDDFKMGN